MRRCCSRSSRARSPGASGILCMVAPGGARVQEMGGNLWLRGARLLHYGAVVVKRVFELLVRPALVPLWALAIAVLVLVPDLSRPGLWEPQELAVADAALARNERAAHPPAKPPVTTPTPTLMERWKTGHTQTCHKTPPEDATARTLTDREVARGL